MARASKVTPLDARYYKAPTRPLQVKVWLDNNFATEDYIFVMLSHNAAGAAPAE
jgi:hypothetical protein